MAESAKLYMKLTGASQGLIEGEGEAKGHEKQIELDDWRWGIKTPKSNGDPEPSVFAFSKRMDAATTKMLNAMVKGELLSAVIVLEERATQLGSNQSLFSLKMTLENVLVTSYDVDLSIEEKRGEIGENWQFDYETIRFEHTTVGKDGTRSVLYRRPPDAETTGPDRTEDQIFKLAKDMGRKDLETLWNKLIERLDQERLQSKTIKEPAADPIGEPTGRGRR